MSKKTINVIRNYILVIIGTFFLSFGSVIFLTQCELVSGGLSGIAIIIQHFVAIKIYDYVVAGLTVLFWIIGLIFLGKDFAVKTALSSLLYVGFTFLFIRVDIFTEVAKTLAGTIDGGVPQVGNYILCGLFGGVFVGGGVAMTFLGGGSTGGVDVIQLLMSKYFRIKESITSFVVDASVIVVGMLTLCVSDTKYWVPSLCGILSAFVASALIEIVYIRNQTAYQVDISSDKWEESSKYAQEELERGATIIRAEGGFKGEERVILRVVFDKNQYEKIRNYIASVDPKAFVTFTQTNAVFGEGFKHNKKSQNKKKK